MDDTVPTVTRTGRGNENLVRIQIEKVLAIDLDKDSMNGRGRGAVLSPLAHDTEADALLFGLPRRRTWPHMNQIFPVRLKFQVVKNICPE